MAPNYRHVKHGLVPQSPLVVALNKVGKRIICNCAFSVRQS